MDRMDEYKRRQGKRIRTARKVKGLNQPELAEKVTAELGYYFGDDAKVSRIEQGKQDVSGHELYALSVVLEQPIPWLQGVTDDGFNIQAMGVYLGSLIPRAA